MSRAVKNIINANIKQNGRQEITGNVLNGVLNAMVTDYDQQGEEFSKKVLKVNINDLLSDYADSILELSQKYGIILVTDEDDSGNLIATILPTRDDGYSWLYEWVEGWRIVEAPVGFSFDWQDASFKDLLEYFDSDSSAVANADYVNAQDQRRVLVVGSFDKISDTLGTLEADPFNQITRRYAMIVGTANSGMSIRILPATGKLGWIASGGGGWYVLPDFGAYVITSSSTWAELYLRIKANGAPISDVSEVAGILTRFANYYTKAEADVEFAPRDEFQDVQNRVDGITRQGNTTYVDEISISDLQKEIDATAANLYKTAIIVNENSRVRYLAPQGTLPQLASKAAMYVVTNTSGAILHRIFFAFGKVLLLQQNKILVGSSINTTDSTTWAKLVTWMVANYNEVVTKNEVVLLSGDQSIGGMKEFEEEVIIDSGIDMQSTHVKYLPDPEDDYDASNKHYVDGKDSAMKTYVDNKDSSMKAYVDGKDTAMKAYVDGIANDIMTIAEVDALFE